MQSQIHTDLCLPAYMQVSMYSEGFVIKVTRQIPSTEEAFAYFKILPQFPDSDTTEVYSFKGRNYITCRKFFNWSDGFYPNHSKVLDIARHMHEYIMYHITSYKIQQLQIKLECYTEL